MLLKYMIKANSSDVSSQVLAEMKKYPLSAVVFPEAVAFANKIIPEYQSTTFCEPVYEEVTNASMMTPLEEDNATVCMDTAVCAQDKNSLSPHNIVMDTTPPQHAQDNLTQSTTCSDVTADGSLAEMTLETLNIPSHMDTSTVYHCICVLLSLLFRFPVNFKPLYRLAWLFYNLKAYQVGTRVLNCVFQCIHCSLQKCVCWDHYLRNYNRQRFHHYLYSSLISSLYVHQCVCVRACVGGGTM